MGQVEKENISAGEASTTNVCVTKKGYDKKWRLPNQRELFIITSYMPGDNGAYSYEKKSITSCTKSAFTPSDNPNRIYFAYKADIHNIAMKARKEAFLFRCISDKY